MKKVNFNHSGGFPLEQETLERLQKADKSELYEALKAHLSLDNAFNYILASPKNSTKGLAIVHQGEKDSQDKVENRGILYPISPGTDTGYLKTTRSGTNLVYGDGTSQTAYFDYEAQYISQTEYDTADKNGTNNTESSTVYYYELKNFRKVMDLATLEAILAGLDNSVKANTKAIGENTTAIGKIKEDYLPRDGSKSMTGNLTVDGKLYLNNTNSVNSDGSILVLDSSNQVIKGNSLINPLLNSVTDLVNRVIELEKKQTSAIPKGMVAIWGKPRPFPEGWEEYVPLRGRMPLGLKINDSTFNTLLNVGGNKDKTLLIEELPPHFHHKPDSHFKSFAAGSKDLGGNTSTGTSTDGSDSNSQLAIGELGSNYDFNGDALEQTVGEGQTFSILNPYRVVHFIEYTGNTIDTIAPNAPTNLMVENIGRTFIKFIWTTPSDNRRVTNYQIYKDDVLIDTIDSTPVYTAERLSRSTSYNFYIKALDAEGNISDASETIRAKTNLL